MFNRIKLFSLSWRLLWREVASGSLTAVILALIVAQAALSSVSFLAERVEGAIERRAFAALGGDLLLAADHRLPPLFLDEARRRGLLVAESALFPSMARYGEASLLVEVKAVSDRYPLRGFLLGKKGDEEVRIAAPHSGEAWGEARLLASLAVPAGEKIALGKSEFVLAGILASEPDRPLNPFALAPRLIIALEDLPATGLDQPGSRISWRLHLAGEPDAIAAYRQWAKTRLGRGERLEGLDDARPELRLMLERAQRFLRLSALFTVTLAGLAVGLATRRFAHTHVEGFAVLRAFGARSNELLMLYVGMFLAAGVVAVLAGGVLGFGLHLVLLAPLANLLSEPLPLPTLRPLLLGSAVILVVLMGLALPQLLRLRGVPAVYVLRHEWPLLTAAAAGAWGIGALALAGLAVLFAGEAKLAVFVIGGFLVAVGVFIGASHALLAVCAVASERLRGSMRLGLANLARRRVATIVQLVSLALGLSVLILLLVAREDLLASWHARIPPEAPNRFVINIQPEQRKAVSDFFRRAGLGEIELAPMVRGRLVAIAGRTVRPDDYADTRAKRLAEREFNLSMRADPPPENRIVAGRWFLPASQGIEFSVEQGLAETLGMRLGDRLAFAIAGRTLEGRITSLRKLAWDSMRVNFFVIAPPGSLDDQPMSFITSFHLPPEKEKTIAALLREFPNLTVIDVTVAMRQVEEMLALMVEVLAAVFGFALAAGLVVLFVASEGSLAERRQELALLRALGARRRQLRAVLLVEFSLLGAAAGGLAAACAAAIATVLARGLFELDYWPALAPFAAAAFLAFLAVMGLGLMLTRQAYRAAVIEGLRETS